MKALKLLGATAMAMLVLTALTAASASAEPAIELLPGDAFPVAFTSTSGTGTLSTANASITCTADTNTGSFTTATTGTVTVIFTGCKDSKASKCKSSTAKNNEEIILEAAGVQLVAYLNAAKALLAGMVITLTAQLKITCGVLKDTVEGSVLGALTPLGEEVTAAQVDFKATGAGKQELTTCTEPAAFCAKGPFGLKSDLGKGVETAAEETLDKISSKVMFKIKA